MQFVCFLFLLNYKYSSFECIPLSSPSFFLFPPHRHSSPPHQFAKHQGSVTSLEDATKSKSGALWEGVRSPCSRK